jgi:MFS transporter, DHA2 family, multidrug resistance protein
MIPWEISRRNPVRMIATRQFAACFLVMLATGALLFGATQFLPQLVQQDFAYTATWAGLVLSPGGVVTMVMMFVAGRLSGKVQPKYLIAVGAVLIAASIYVMTNVYGDLDFWFMARSRMLFGVGIPLVFIPITAAAYDGVPGMTTPARGRYRFPAEIIGHAVWTPSLRSAKINCLGSSSTLGGLT